MTAFCLAVVLTATSAAGEAARELTWDDLVPALPPLENPFAHLTMEQRVLLHGIAGIRAEKRMGLITEVSREYEMAMEDADTLTREGLDVEALLAKFDELEAEIQRRNEAVVDELDGRLVRMPGYALPLEFSGTGVRELLLVPYVGACIHVPPPPPNQMVFVRLDRSFVAKDVYEPVWVTGRMTVQRASKSLSLVDGSANVDAGYTLHGLTVEPYEQ